MPIGQPSQFDGTQLSAIVYGAPDPGAPSGIGNLNNFIYVGTVGNVGTTPANVGNGGNIFVTTTGGQGWTNISSGLDGSSVVAIYTNPNRTSHEAYAVTLNGVFYSPDTIGLSAAGKVVWTNITNNLSQIQHQPVRPGRHPGASRSRASSSSRTRARPTRARPSTAASARSWPITATPSPIPPGPPTPRGMS